MLTNLYSSYEDNLPESFNQTTVNDAKIPLSVDIRLAKMLLLKLPSVWVSILIVEFPWSSTEVLNISFFSFLFFC